MRRHFMFFGAVLWLVFDCGAQQTAFTYQGRLIDNGAPATGTYDLTLSLWSGSSGPPQIGGTLTNSSVAVNNGLFTVTLDFGSGVFSGAERWLEIGVRTNGSGGFVTLAPRQKLTATPYAITAGNVTGVVSNSSVAGTYSNAVAFSNPANIFNGSFTGNGNGLSNVNALTLGGLASAAFWQLGGNTVAPGQFLGSTNNQPVEIKAGNQRALRIEPNTNGAPNVIAGSQGNQVAAGVIGATISGGQANTVPTDAPYATIPGGVSNSAGAYAFAAGRRAKASHHGAFVWADSTNADFSSTTSNQFSVRANGGVVFQTSGRGISLDGQSVLSGLVGTSQLADGAITGPKLAALSVNNSKLTLDSVSTPQLADGAVTGPKLAALSVNNSKLTLDSVSTPQLADGAVTGPKLAALSVNNSKLTLDSVSTPQLVNDSVTSAKIANGSVLAEDLNIGSFGTAFWNANGNAGTTPGLNFLGTTDNQPLDFRVNNQRALRLEPNATSPNVLVGYAGNVIGGGVGALIAGGGNSTFPNTVSGNYCAVLGGQGNTAAGDSCTAMGYRNTANGSGTTAMGRESSANGTASVAMGEFSTAIDYCLAAGRRAKANAPGCFVWADSQPSDFASTAPNQFLIRAAGGVGIGTAAPIRTLDVNGAVGVFDSDTRNFNAGLATEVGAQLLNVGINDGPFNRFGGSFAAGNQGGFLRTDARGGEPLFGFFGRPAGASGDVGRLGYIESSGTVRFEIGNLQKFSLGGKGTFEIDAPGFIGGRFYMTDGGDIGIGTTNPKERLQVIGNIAASGVICANNGVNCISDRNAKAGFEPVDSKAILEKVAALPIARWHYTNDAATPHLGPVAQDFYAAFRVGSDDKRIATVDADGVALAAIQGLDAIVKEKEARIASLEKSVAELRELVAKLSGKQ